MEPIFRLILTVGVRMGCPPPLEVFSLVFREANDAKNHWDSMTFNNFFRSLIVCKIYGNMLFR
jgi:hypothetical protein